MLLAAGKRAPVELVKWTSSSSMVASSIFISLCHTVITNPPGINTIKLIRDSGIVECFAGAAKGFELSGAGAVAEANPGLYIHALLVLQNVDLTAPEAKPIVEQLRQIPTALKFMLDHDLVHLGSMRMTTAAVCAPICALIFGKQEEGDVFNEVHIDSLLMTIKDMFDGSLQAFFAKTPHFLKPIEALCISDANKMLLVKSSALIPLLLSALFLEADHILSDLDRDVKAAIQMDAANCFLQIAVFGPGREMLAAEGAAMEALHALADGHALTPEAKLSAAGAIMAIEGRSHEPQPESMAVEHGVEGKHLMVSCECRRRLLACWMLLTCRGTCAQINGTSRS